MLTMAFGSLLRAIDHMNCRVPLPALTFVVGISHYDCLAALTKGQK